MSETTENASREDKRPGKVALFLRLTRFQFIPLIILPGLVGTCLAFFDKSRINLWFFGLVIFGIAVLHLGANAIDDSYDYQNGVDGTANRMFPKDFGGWKPIPRGYIALRDAKIVSFGLFALSLAIGLYFWYSVGPWAFILAFLGFLLALFYCAPPLKLDYRGLGIGELAIFFSFGPIPVLGAYYVQTGFLSTQALLVSIPVGIMTVTILIYHDLIFYEVYSTSKKYSLGTVLGRKNALGTSLALTVAGYSLVVVYSLVLRILPIWSLAAPALSALVLSRKSSVFGRPSEPPHYYVSFTQNGLLANWIFTLAIALSLIV